MKIMNLAEMKDKEDIKTEIYALSSIREALHKDGKHAEVTVITNVQKRLSDLVNEACGEQGMSGKIKDDIETFTGSGASPISVGEVEALSNARYEKTVSIGAMYVAEMIEGSADDILKVIKGLVRENENAEKVSE